MRVNRLATFTLVFLSITSCKPRNTSELEATTQTHSAALPAVLYAGGVKSVYLKSIADGSIDPKIFENKIIGRPGRIEQKDANGHFNLPYWRHGVYGTSHAPIAYKYMFGQMFPDDEPRRLAWFEIMEIDVDACGNPAVIFDAKKDLSIAAGSPFVDWLKTGGVNLPNYPERPDAAPFQSYEEIQKECFKNGTFDYGPGHGSETPENRCALLIPDYIKFRKAVTIVDNDEIFSWYFRDVKCIKHVSGTADDIVKLLSDDDSPLLRAADFVDNSLSTLPYLVVGALADAKSLDDSKLQRLADNIAAMAKLIDRSKGGFQDKLGEYFDFLVRLSKRGVQCAQNAKLKTFQARLAAYIATFLSQQDGISYDSLDNDQLCKD